MKLRSRSSNYWSADLAISLGFLLVLTGLAAFVVAQNEETTTTTTTDFPETDTDTTTINGDSTPDTPEPWVPPINNNSDSMIFDELIPKGYNKFEVPKDTDRANETGVGEPPPPLVVHIFLRIHSLLEIDEERERLTLDTDVEVYWRDWYMFKYGKRSEKGFDWRSVDPKLLDHIWQPDVYIEGMISSTKAGLMGIPAHLRLRSSFGQMIYKFRLSPVIKCSMEFGYYPADTQNCSFTLRSYAYSYNDVELHWYSGTGVLMVDPSDANFDLQVASTSRDRVVYRRTYQGVGYDTLHFTILARRKLSYHLLQTYIPSALFVGITWLCFLLPTHMVEARIGITMTTLLTLTAMFASVRESTPTVSYVKAIDVWMVACIDFVFLILVQFAVSTWLRAKLKKRGGSAGHDEDRKPTENGSREFLEPRDCDPEGECAEHLPPLQLELTPTRTLLFNILLRAGHLFEQVSLFIYATVFFLFAALYWNWLLTAGGYFDWSVSEVYTPGFEN